MAPQVGFEPTTDRLTADSSTTELLWINKNLPGNVLLSRDVSPTTIGARELNFCVRYGNRCDLSAIVTRQTGNIPSKLDRHEEEIRPAMPIIYKID